MNHEHHDDREAIWIDNEEYLNEGGLIPMKQKLVILFFTLFLVGAFFLNPGASWAQQGAKLDLKTTVEKEVKVKKKGQWVMERIPVEKTGPGDTLIYTIAYHNAGKIAVIDATIINPLPRGIVYVLESAAGKDADITCSINGGQSFHPSPVTERIRKPDGIVEVKPAAADRYTHIKWIIKKPVQPGQSGRVSFKATVK
jgi:uncharacterized repeat protein (TIGR01451 family)